MSGRASLISRFILRMTPICSSLFKSEYFSSRILLIRPPCDALYVSKLAFDNTTMSRWVSLSLEGMGVCCSATSCGSSGGGHDCVPKRLNVSESIWTSYHLTKHSKWNQTVLGRFFDRSSGAMCSSLRMRYQVVLD